MAAKRISIAALCNDQPHRLSNARSGASLPPSATRRPSDSSSSDASGSSVPPYLQGSPSPTRTSSTGYDPIRDAENRHDDPQSTRPISSLSPATPPPPSAHIRKPPLAPTPHTSALHFTPIAPRPDPASIAQSVKTKTPVPNAPSARPAQQQQQTRLLAIPPSNRYTPYPPQPSRQALAYSKQVSPSSRTDLQSNNGPIEFEFYDPNNAAGSSTSRRSSKSKANRASPSSSSVAKPGPTNMSANPKKSKSKSKVAAVGQAGQAGQEEASNTSGGAVLGSNTRGETMPNTVARNTSPSASGRLPTPGAASNANSSTMGDAPDVEMELLHALGGDEETRAESASLGARGPSVKLDTQSTTGEDELLQEVEAIERTAAHKPPRETPSMSSPVKHEHETEEGDAMEIDLKVRTTHWTSLSRYPLLITDPFFPSTAIHALPLACQPPARATPVAYLTALTHNPNPILQLRTPVPTYLGLAVPSPHALPRTYAHTGRSEPPRPAPTWYQHQERPLEEHRWSRQSERGDFQDSSCKADSCQEEAEPRQRE
jgi:hypothetical protein